MCRFWESVHICFLAQGSHSTRSVGHQSDEDSSGGKIVLRENLKTSEKGLRVFLVGSGISKSLSPAIHNRAFEKARFNAKYSLFDVSDRRFESEIVKIQRADDILGFNVTVPYKERIIPYVSHLDEQSKLVGAVNTVKVSNGQMSGFNTDVDGVEFTLFKLGIGITSKKCVILGAGGAAKACVYAVLKNGFDNLTVLNRSIDRANKLSVHFGKLFPDASIDVLALERKQLSRAIGDSDLLINATTSSKELAAYIDFTSAPRIMKFFDLDYRGISPLLKEAAKHRIKSIDGLPMLVEQAAKSFEIWTGIKAPRKAMNIAAKKELSRVSYSN